MTLPHWKSPDTDKHGIIEPLLADGLSFAEVAAHFEGASRSAVIGWCSRQKIKSTAPKTGRPKVSAEPKSRAGRHAKVKRRPVNTLGTFRQTGERQAAQPLPIAQAPMGEGVPFMEASTHQCHAPKWDIWPGSDSARYCGEPCVDGKPYCPMHMNEFTNPLAGQRQTWTVGDEAVE